MAISLCKLLILSLRCKVNKLQRADWCHNSSTTLLVPVCVVVTGAACTLATSALALTVSAACSLTLSPASKAGLPRKGHPAHLKASPK